MTQILHPTQNNSHGLACDGLQIAKDDLHEIENVQKQNDAVWELFQNAARIRGAMKSNRLLRPIFRKYKRTCREILQRKNDEAAQMLTLCDYCDSCNNNGNNNGNNHDGSNHDLKDIQYEMREIHDKIKSLEEMQLDTDSDSDFDSSDSDNEYAEDVDADAEDNDDDHHDEDDDDNDDDDSISSSASSSSASSLSDLMDMENFSR